MTKPTRQRKMGSDESVFAMMIATYYAEQDHLSTYRPWLGKRLWMAICHWVGMVITMIQCSLFGKAKRKRGYEEGPRYAWPTTGARIGAISVDVSWMAEHILSDADRDYLSGVEMFSGARGRGWCTYPENERVRKIFGLPNGLEWYTQRQAGKS